MEYLKKRFRIIAEANDYPIATQAKLVPALCALHNFIRIYDPADEMEITEEEIEGFITSEEPAIGSLQNGIPAAETARSNERRELISKEMWDSYCAEVHRRNARARESRAQIRDQMDRIRHNSSNLAR